MKWIVSAVVLMAAVVCGCQKKKEIKVPTATDFETLSGKDLPVWQYIQTKEDHAHFQFFKALYERGRERSLAAPELKRIPKVAHFVWIGPRQFPRESVENVRTWIAQNPDWTFCFWTDRDRPTPVPGMQTRMIQDLQWLKLAECFSKSVNYCEKSDLLRYEILFQEGGVYVDHDVKCFKPFDQLNEKYDFYCGMDMPYTSSLPSCVYTTNNLIGARAGHPILWRCMELVEAQWDKIQKDYPGHDRDDDLNRVLHRTFWLFGTAVKEMNNHEDNRDIVFPAYYFDAPKDELAIYARHQYAGVWHDKESPFEKMVRQRLMILSKKSNKTLLFFGVLSGLNMIGFATLFVMIRKNRIKT